MHYALVIEDTKKAHRAKVAMMTDAYRRAGLREREATALAEAGEGEPAVGDLWTTADVECPDGKPNCRHCGDPAHREACAAAGHCDQCGTRHGIAPASVLEAKGLALQALAERPRDGQTWDRQRRRFVTAPAGTGA
jgi:hypothetical protein